MSSRHLIFVVHTFPILSSVFVVASAVHSLLSPALSTIPFLFQQRHCNTLEDQARYIPIIIIMSAPTVDSSDSATASAAASAATDAATYDLTSRISPYLDLHMMFPLLEYIDSLISAGSIPYSSLDVAQARLELLKPTHMVDYAMDIYREVHGEDATIPAEMEEQKAGVFKELEELREGQMKLDELCRNEELRVSGYFAYKNIIVLTQVLFSARFILFITLYLTPISPSPYLPFPFITI